MCGLRHALVVLLIFSQGCLILPKTETRKRLLERRTDTEATRPGPVVLDASIDGSRVTVTAQRPRVCTYIDRDIIRVTRSTSAELDVPSGGGGGGSAEAAVAIIIIAPVVLLVSGLITAIVVGVSSDETRTETFTRDTRRRACPVPLRNQAIFVSLGSGRQFTRNTDSRGRATFHLPPGASALSRITVRVGELSRVFHRGQR